MPVNAPTRWPSLQRPPVVARRLSSLQRLVLSGVAACSLASMGAAVALAEGEAPVEEDKAAAKSPEADSASGSEKIPDGQKTPEATAAQATPTVPTPIVYTDPATLQAHMEDGRFDNLSEDQLRVLLKDVDPVVLVDAALTYLVKRPEYSTVLEKQERLRGDLQDEADVIKLWYRRDPLSIFARYIGGEHIGREILYNEAALPGQITVAEAGLLGDMVSIHIDVNSNLTKRSTNHTVLEMGLEFPLAMMRSEIEELKKAGLAPSLADGRLVEVDGRRYWELEVKTAGPPLFYAAHSKLLFDVSTALVAQMEIWDKDGNLLERFRYRDTQWGANPEGTFNEDNPEYRF